MLRGGGLRDGGRKLNAWGKMNAPRNRKENLTVWVKHAREVLYGAFVRGKRNAMHGGGRMLLGTEKEDECMRNTRA